MRRFLASAAVAAWLASPFALATESWTQDKSLSLGVTQPISSDGWGIPGWTMLGVSQILRDRVIMTPPAPGSQRSAIWSDHKNPYNEWSVEISFRATGEERSGGSFHFWYTAGGVGYAGTDSVYTARPWDGLAILVDKYGAYGGSVRGFLNDGRTDYSIHHNVASLAFGHCDFNYRNLGAPSLLRITHTYQGLKVETDGKTCFETKDVRLPSGSYFGLSAASADSPDSFELFSLKTSTPEAAHQQIVDHQDKPQEVYGHGGSDPHKATQETINNQKREGNQEFKGKLPHETAYEEFKVEEDKPASSYKTQEDQFTDLHNRLTALTHHLAQIQSQIGSVYDGVDSALNRMDDFRNEARHKWVPRDQVDRMEGRLSTVENILRDLEKTLNNKDYSKHFDSIHTALRDQHSNLLFAVPDSVAHAIKTNQGFWGRWGGWLQFMAVVACAGGYVTYKRRKSAGTKKYL
ncbi:concanavalin A-like lectin/glucanase domain-containing protein [Peziza echinospora]|nr:concanavalin A-like lectin/glucanase domain-containing protein [Peziza echinospora]